MRSEIMKSAAFGAVMFASSAINNIFVTYYLDLFTQTTYATLNATWFYIGQSIFMTWNAFNDPLFGWMCDKLGLKRTYAIRWGGLFWCFAFLLIWWPWGNMTGSSTYDVSSWNSWDSFVSGLHFTLSLCLYDSALTFVELNHNSLLPELSKSQSVRASANAWSAAAAALGSVSSVVAYATYDRADLTRFRIFVLTLAFICWMTFEFSYSVLEENASILPSLKLFVHSRVMPLATKVVRMVKGPKFHFSEKTLAFFAPNEVIESAPIVHTESSIDNLASQADHSSTRRRNVDAEVEEKLKSDELTDSEAILSSLPPYTLFLKQIMSHTNFLLFSIISTLQVFDCTFEKNFFAPFMDVLLPTSQHNSTLNGLKGTVISLSFLLPHLCTIILTPLIQRNGLHATINLIFFLRLSLIIVAFVLGPSSGSLILAFMLVNRVISEAICRLTPLVTADLSDEDAYLNKRSGLLSASLIGSVSFVSKFSQSLAPMLGYYLLPSEVIGGESEELRGSQYIVWLMLLLIPLLTVIIQTCLWSMYTLKGSYLKQVKETPLLG